MDNGTPHDQGGLDNERPWVSPEQKKELFRNLEKSGQLDSSSLDVLAWLLGFKGKDDV